MAFGSATNIVATSLDSYEGLICQYKNAYTNVAALRAMGATLLFGVDATQMKTLPHLWGRRFHRIIYNFPHAGFYGKEDNPELIMMHRNLVRGFLENASSMLLLDGEIHINHKTTAPFNSWRIEDLGAHCSLLCTEQDKFNREDYPWYYNKRGAGLRCDEPFPLGACTTFKFKLRPAPYYNPCKRRKLDLMEAAPSVSPFALSDFNSSWFGGRTLQNFGGVKGGFGMMSDGVFRIVEESSRTRLRYMRGSSAREGFTGFIGNGNGNGNGWNPPF